MSEEKRGADRAIVIEAAKEELADVSPLLSPNHFHGEQPHC